MRIDIITLFPELVEAVLGESIIVRVQKAGLLSISATNPRDFTSDRHRKTDDYPYGGGKGMVMLAEPLYLAHAHVCAGEQVHTVLMSAQGAPFTQEKARELLARERFILVCGHYEGVDQRFIDACVDEEISLGDFVLTGGEIPAMAVADAVCRMVPGVLAEESSFTEESHWSGLLEYPQYTRPESWRGRAVPEILLGGHHAKIERWRRMRSIEKTAQRRPDMLAGRRVDKAEMKLLSELFKQRSE